MGVPYLLKSVFPVGSRGLRTSLSVDLLLEELSSIATITPEITAAIKPNAPIQSKAWPKKIQGLFVTFCPIINNKHKNPKITNTIINKSLPRPKPTVNRLPAKPPRLGSSK